MIDPPDINDLGDPRPRNYMVPGPKIVDQHGKTEAISQGPTFAEQAYRPKYAFPGIAPFIDRSAEKVAFADHSLRSRVKGDWFITSASNALGNACCQPRREHAQSSLDRAVALRDTLALALAATEAAITETARQLELPEPSFARKPEVNTHGPRRLRRAEHPGE